MQHRWEDVIVHFTFCTKMWLLLTLDSLSCFNKWEPHILSSSSVSMAFFYLHPLFCRWYFCVFYSWFLSQVAKRWNVAVSEGESASEPDRREGKRSRRKHCYSELQEPHQVSRKPDGFALDSEETTQSCSNLFLWETIQFVLRAF